jgi:hypothetical protein
LHCTKNIAAEFKIFGALELGHGCSAAQLFQNELLKKSATIRRGAGFKNVSLDYPTGYRPIATVQYQI